jgi:hypothetical protein
MGRKFCSGSPFSTVRFVEKKSRKTGIIREFLGDARPEFSAVQAKRGIWHGDADNDVNEGIRVASMVLNQRLVRFCRQTVPRTIQEMQTYAWDSKAAQRGEEKPLKIRDHGPDAFRYFAKTEVPYWRLGWGS